MQFALGFAAHDFDEPGVHEFNIYFDRRIMAFVGAFEFLDFIRNAGDICS